MEIIKENENVLKKELEEIITNLDSIINEKIDTIKKDPTGEDYENDDKLKDFDVDYIIDNLSKDKKCYLDILLRDLLTYYLDKLKESNVKKYFELMRGFWTNDEYDKIAEKYKKASRLIDDVIDYCDPCTKYRDVYEDAEYIASTLIRKKIEFNGHCLSEPLEINYIKYYSISADIPPKEFYNEIWYIILYTAVHYNVLKDVK